MPKAHTNYAVHLLQWPVIRDLVSQACDPQALMQTKLARPPLDLQPPYSLDLDLAGKPSSYTRAFFEKVNVWYAVVDPYSWHAHFRTASAVGFRSGAETCVVLLVLALGQAAHSGHSISRLPEAWLVLPSLMIRNDALSAQCHILAAAYLFYVVRPLEAWNLLSNASIKLQLLLANQSAIQPQVKELSERVFWNALMIESDLLTELDLPHSGIVQFEDSMRLPRSFPYDATIARADELPGNDDLWYFLAEIALRRLLNRVSHMIYSQKRTSISSLEPVVVELDFQLNQWYEGLPPSIRFPRERLPARDQVQTVLRLRYFACRTIIFRPYIQAVLQDETLAQEPAVQMACRECLEACVRQLENISAHHDGHLPYLWQGALSITSQTLLLMGATLSSVLSSLLPSRAQIDVVIDDRQASGYVLTLSKKLKTGDKAADTIFLSLALPDLNTHCHLPMPRQDRPYFLLATELELLKSMFADQVDYDTKGREVVYGTDSGALRVRLPDGYLQDALPDVVSASIGKTDIRDKMKQRIAGFGPGDGILDSIIMAFNELIDHVTATENIITDQKITQPDNTSKATIVVWLHHLLNTSKRKQCLHPPSAGISGVTKPGYCKDCVYPGVLVYSGPSTAVREHVNELKALNWAAFQVRLEQDHEWKFKHGEGVVEVESMGEVVTEIDVGDDGRKDMFLEAMKMNCPCYPGEDFSLESPSKGCACPCPGPVNTMALKDDGSMDAATSDTICDWELGLDIGRAPLACHAIERSSSHGRPSRTSQTQDHSWSGDKRNMRAINVENRV
ncbi:uncharacterized protein MYCFIDRAFT_176389 [Pseudocercospora fijiensis CIRAD86]|uniref:Transcription factor domain-containing protein n=1 Tax=Pseudocercospora fijiensis (strain CIRAD86) TaxID=383855 RepID=M3AV67_PSEFD|nr:uncharacterized protein MYCFIDRAFT_176389 [Pseudocercospora fijiensis CIRAD86]EME81053.1 hypothetical protein MYCFIDRAFT_176389 [Pseudocercospora fijiensis CIRAD86]